MTASVASSEAGAETRRMLLRVSHPAQGTLFLPLARAQVVLGRAEDVDVPLDSHTVSRVHAELVRDPFDRWWVRDRESRNGTRVNGVKVKEGLVRPGDQVQIGDFTLSIAPAAPPVEARSTMGDARLSIMQGTPDRISRLREFEAPKIGHAHLTAVLEFGHAIAVTPDAGERLRRLCELMLGGEIRARSVAVLRAERAAPESAQVLFGPEPPTQGFLPPPPISASVLRAVCEEPEPVLATNVSPAPDQVQLSISVDEMALSVVAVPLRSDEASVDILYVVLLPECGHSDWLALVSLAVEQYHQAESVWLNVEQIKEYAVIQRELERAQRIQQRLIPADVRLPGLEVAVGFRPCHWVGGDYVDVVPMADGRVLMVIADVCGKGLSAALVASSIHTLVHSAVRSGESIPGLAARLNDYFCEFLGTDSFATLLAIAVDPASGACECVCAGHPPGLVVGRDGALRQLALDQNVPLGIDPGQPVTTRNAVAPGELLALFTDGVTEAGSDDGRMLGQDGFGQALRGVYAGTADRPLADLVDQINVFLDAYQGPGIATDDRTFLLVRLRPG